MDQELKQPAPISFETIPVNQTPPSPKSKLPLVLLVIILLFLFGIGGILLGKSLGLPKNIFPTPTLGPQPTIPTAIPDWTTNWKTYTNNKYAYQFKYPEKDHDNVLSEESPEIWTITGHLMFKVEGIKTSITDPLEWWQSQEVETFTKLNTDDFNYEIKINLGEIKGRVLSLELKPDKQEPRKTFRIYIIPHNNQLLKLILDYSEEPDQILSTFKFLDQNQVIDTANWKTYTNEKYSYTIKYPTEVEVDEKLEAQYTDLIGPIYQDEIVEYPLYQISIKVIKNADKKMPGQFAQELYNESKKRINDNPDLGNISDCKIESATRDNTKGYRFTYCTKDPGSGLLDFSEWYVKNGITYEILAILRSEDFKYKTTLNQILSTFKFTSS